MMTDRMTWINTNSKKPSKISEYLSKTKTLIDSSMFSTETDLVELIMMNSSEVSE